MSFRHTGFPRSVSMQIRFSVITREIQWLKIFSRWRIICLVLTFQCILNIYALSVRIALVTSQKQSIFVILEQICLRMPVFHLFESFSVINTPAQLCISPAIHYDATSHLCEMHFSVFHPFQWHNMQLSATRRPAYISVYHVTSEWTERAMWCFAPLASWSANVTNCGCFKRHQTKFKNMVQCKSLQTFF